MSVTEVVELVVLVVVVVVLKRSDVVADDAQESSRSGVTIIGHSFPRVNDPVVGAVDGGNVYDGEHG